MMTTAVSMNETRESKSYSQLISAIVAATIVILPFYNGSTTAMGLALSEVLLLSMGIVALVGRFVERKTTIRLSAFELAILVFLFTAAISALNSVYPIDAWRAVGFYLLLAIGFRVSFSTAINNGTLAKLVQTALLTSGVIQSIVAIHQFFFTGWYAQVFPDFYATNLRQNIRGGVLRVVGGFINPNYLAAFLNICLAVGLAMFLFKRMRLSTRIAVAVAEILFLFTIILSGSKGAILVTAVIVTILLALKDKRFLLASLIIILLLVAVPNPIKEQFERAITADPYISMRPHFWQSTWQMITDNPLFGVGPNNFHFVSPRYAPSTDFLLVRFSGYNRIAHNAFLHMLAELGILGAIPLAILMIIGLAIFRKIISAKAMENEHMPLLFGIVFGLIGLMLHSLVDNVGLNRCILVVSALLFGQIAAWAHNTADSNFTFFNRQWQWSFDLRGSVPKMVALIILVFGFAAAQIFMPLYYEFMITGISGRVESDFALLDNISPDQTTSNNAGAVISSSIERLQKDLNSLNSLAAVFPDNLTLLRTIGNVNQVLFRYYGDMSYFYDSLSSFEHAAKSLNEKSSVDYYSVLKLYFDLKEQGFPKTAEILNEMREYVRRAIKNYPSQAVLYRMAAMIEMESNRPAGAIQLLEQAVVLEPNYLQAIADLGMLAMRMNRTELVRRAERMYSAAEVRIKQGPKPDPSDDYANMIIRKPAGIQHRLP